LISIGMAGLPICASTGEAVSARAAARVMDFIMPSLHEVLARISLFEVSPDQEFESKRRSAAAVSGG
jgi:hypothetical protein